MANWGFGVFKESSFDKVKTFLDKDGRTTPFQDNTPGNKWFRFLLSETIWLNYERHLLKKRAKISKEDLELQ